MSSLGNLSAGKASKVIISNYYCFFKFVCSSSPWVVIAMAENEAQFSRLFAVIDGIQDQMSSFKRELAKDRAEATDEIVKKMKLEKKVTFKKKTHEKQHDFNEEVCHKISVAQRSLDSATTPDVEKAMEALKEGEKLISARQKLIKVADRSEFGWATVKEYVEDDLADNSDDEKRLFRAEMRAGRKTKSAKAKAKTSFVSRKSFIKPSQLGDSVAVSQYGKNPSRDSPIVHGQPSVKPAQLGPCFQCGKIGHFRRACPLLVGTTSK